MRWLSTKVNMRPWSLETPIVVSPFLLKTQSTFLAWTLTANFSYLINTHLLPAERSIINLTSCCDSENWLPKWHWQNCTRLSSHCIFNIYCSSVWHFCGAQNVGKLENLNQTILRFILDDFESAYNILLDELSQLCFSVCTTDVFTILC